MAFGWKTEYEKRVPIEGLTSWEVFIVAKKACEELEWEHLIADEKTFTATTPIHWTLNEEIITIVLENEQIIFKSQSESLELYEAGRNKKNIEEHFIPAFNKAKQAIAAETLRSEAELLRQETVTQLSTGTRVAGDKISFGIRDHEVTFYLILVNIVVFVLMVVKGVDLYYPSSTAVTQWGGNVREFVAAGDWWRLVTNLFLNIGIQLLVANIIGLYFIGLLVETILGKVKYLIAYLTTGALASLASIYFQGYGVSAGASAAVAGLYGILIAFASTGYVNKKFNKFWFAGIVAYGAFVILYDSEGRIDKTAALAGLVAGIVVGYLFYFFHFRRNVARAGGTRISVEIMLLSALLIFLFIRSGKDDSLRFEKAVMKLNQIELKAMNQMQDLQTADDDKEAARILKEKALPLWKNFQKEINRTDRYHLDEQFNRKRKLLHEYAELRIRQTELIYKSMQEDTEKYNEQIEKVSERTEKIIDSLGI